MEILGVEAQELFKFKHVEDTDILKKRNNYGFAKRNCRYRLNVSFLHVYKATNLIAKYFSKGIFY